MWSCVALFLEPSFFPLRKARPPPLLLLLASEWVFLPTTRRRKLVLHNIFVLPACRSRPTLGTGQCYFFLALSLRTHNTYYYNHKGSRKFAYLSAPCVSNSYFGLFPPQRRTHHHDDLRLRLFFSGRGRHKPLRVIAAARHKVLNCPGRQNVSVNDDRRDTASFRSEGTRVGTSLSGPSFLGIFNFCAVMR